MEINSTRVYFRSRIMLCFADDTQKTLILNQEKKSKRNYSGNKNLFKTVKQSKSKGLVLRCHVFFFDFE